DKLERDMVSHQADYGFIVATCEGDKIIRNDNSTDQEQKLKKIEEWANSKLPKYIIDLQKQLENQESAVNAIIDKANKIKKFKEEIYRLAMSNMWRHPEKDAQKNVYPVNSKFLYEKNELKSFKYIKIGKNKEQEIKNLRNDVVIGELKGKKDIFFSYNSCEYPSSLDNYLTFKGGIVIKTVGEEWVFPTINEIAISFPNREERDEKYQEFESKAYCLVEGVDWEKVRMGSKDLKIEAFSK
ncbi:7079_t:CDS:2, partial [Racocetra persica]